MPKIIFISPEGVATEAEVSVGTTVMAAAVGNGIEGIVAECGGVCMCATCHVFVHEDFWARLPPTQDTEEAVLEITAEARVRTSRLSCQIKMTEALDGMVVQIPEKQR